MKHIRTPLTLLVLFSCISLFAQKGENKNASPFKFLIKGGLELGGDRVAEVYFTNGNSQSVKAGQGGTLAVGIQYAFPQLEKLLLHGLVGIKYVTTAADNAHIRLTRIPVQLTANWMAAKKLRIGAGLVTHRNIRFKADGIGDDMAFHPATGPVFEIAYSGIGLSYTPMTYKDMRNNIYSANAVGLTFTFAIPGDK